ncbi:acetoacetyl-CoA synthetase, partial [Trichonephila clavata]
QKHTLDSLKVFMAGGSVVKSQLYEFVREKVKKGIPFTSGFGATEILGSSFVFESTLPIYKGEIPARGLGVAIETVDDNGKPLHGEIGEILITKPMPNLPICLWGDKDGSIYREKYFSKYTGKFSMSDYGVLNPFTKGLRICCRSDETLKQRGCRFGSSEIYNIVETFPEVRDSLCVAKYSKNMDESAVLFLKIKEGYSFNNELLNNIRKAIARELTERHVPDFILEIQDIPYNINGKKVEIIVKKIINKLPYNAETEILNTVKMNSLDFSDIPIMRRPDEKSGTLLKKFKKVIEGKYNVKIGDYWDFHNWSTENFVEFWTEIWNFAGVICSKKFHKVIDRNASMDGPKEWFRGARLNFAENLLKYRDDGIALIVT